MDPLALGVRHRLAVDLDERGLRDEAAEQLELLVKFGGMGSWELNDAARRLADRTPDDAPSLVPAAPDALTALQSEGLFVARDAGEDRP